MARDPFAPMTQPSVPPWIWILGGTVALLFVLTGGIVLAVMSRRPAPTIAAPTAPAAPAVGKGAAPATNATASAAQAAAPDKAPDKAEAADKGGDDKAHRGGRRHRGGGKADTIAAKGPSAPSSPTPAPKRKSDMSQKE